MKQRVVLFFMLYHANHDKFATKDNGEVRKWMSEVEAHGWAYANNHPPDDWKIVKVSAR